MKPKTPPEVSVLPQHWSEYTEGPVKSELNRSCTMNEMADNVGKLVTKISGSEQKSK